MISELRTGTGRWRLAWILHRGSGLGLLAFLVIHVGDTALIRLGPTYYNAVLAIYRNGFFRALETVLLVAVLFHAFNGVRITVMDFWPGWGRHQRALINLTYGLTAVAWLGSAYFMVTR